MILEKVHDSQFASQAPSRRLWFSPLRDLAKLRRMPAAATISNLSHRMKSVIWFVLVVPALALIGPPLQNDSPEMLANRIWTALQSVGWNSVYQEQSLKNQSACKRVPAHTSLRGGLYDYEYHCSERLGEIIVESFYYPANPAAPKILLRRSDFRLAGSSSPETDVAVEELLRKRLTQSYGAGAAPENLSEIGATRPNPGLSWQAGDFTIFLHRNRHYVAPDGIREGVQLIGVRREVLENRQRERQLEDIFRTSTALALPIIEADLQRELGDLYPKPAPIWVESETERVTAKRKTRVTLLRLLNPDARDRQKTAALLVAADDLAVRLGSFMMIRSIVNRAASVTEAPDSSSIRQELAPYGIRYTGPGHYSGVLEYDRSLLRRAWNEFPDTPWGQRAFLMLQSQSCSGIRFNCDGPNCFRSVIQQGEKLLRDHPQTPFRKEQIYHLALAYETWWSLSKAQPGDPTAEGAKIDEQSASAARAKAIDLCEGLARLAPGSPEEQWGLLRLPRLKLSLDTGERRFFCFED